MATTRIMPLHVGKGRTESRAISDIIDYVANPKKTDNGRLITGYACDRSKSCRLNTPNYWKKRKRPMPSTGVPARKCGSF